MLIKHHEEGNKCRLNEGEKHPLAAPGSGWDEVGVPTEGWPAWVSVPENCEGYIYTGGDGCGEKRWVTCREIDEIGK